MKKTSYLYIAAFTAILGCIGTGCQDEFQAVNEMTMTDGNGEGNSSRTQLVEKSLTGIEADCLPTLLTEDEKATVQKLILQGELCGADILFIKTELPQLVELDMSGVIFKILETDRDCYSANNSNLKINNINEIGPNMFYQFGQIEKIVLPQYIEYIKQDAFNGCTNLTNVELPYRLKTIEAYGFMKCSKLEGISFNPYIKEIGLYAFSESGLKSLRITKNIQYINEGAFNNIDSLKSIVLDNNKVSLGTRLFSSCDSLKEVILPAEMETIPAYCFENCTGLESIDLPTGLKYVESYAFGNTGLKKVVIPENVAEIKSYAFNECDSLKEVVFMSKKTKLSYRNFNRCTSLETINLPDIEEIPGDLFDNCSKLRNITIPETVKKIGESPFSGTDIRELTIGPSVTTLGQYCFSNMKLKSLTIPETVTEIGYNIIDQCRELQWVYWYSNCEVPDNYYSESRKNCFLFLKSKNGSVVKWGYGWNNVVIDGVAESIICYHNNSTTEIKFYCPEDIFVKKITFTKSFTGNTYFETACNWKTLSLPFTPTKIATEDGRLLAPFGSSMETEDTKPFWLRTVNEQGFVDTTDIQEYKPYIISMPNSNAYLEEYNINCDVTFIGENITLKATPKTMEPQTGPGYKFYPTMEYVEPAENIYNILYSSDEVFTNNKSVMIFEAYIVKDNETETVDVTRANRASRTTMIYEKKPGVPHITDIR